MGGWGGPRAWGQPGSWTGTWETRWRGGGAILHLQQRGGAVTGTYPLYAGTVEGSSEDGVFTGRWSEASGRNGTFLFTLSREGTSFMGRFDSGEWWTGTRLSESHEYTGHLARLASPRETLRSFLEAANAARGDFIEQVRSGLDTIDFSHPGLRSLKAPGGPLLPGERIEYARRLFAVLDELTFRIWGLPGPSEPGSMAGPTAVATLGQAGTTNTFELRFVSRDGSWLIEPPPVAELERALQRLYERRGGRPRSAREHLQLRTPRDTLRTFIEEMGRFGSGGRTNVLRTMALHDLGVPVREEDATLLAHYLKHVLDRIGFVLYQEIPNDPGLRDPYVHFRHGAGDLVIAPFAGPEGETQWRFTGGTLHSLRRLYAAIEDMPEVSGTVTPGQVSAYFVVRDFLRRHAPGLLRVAGPLEGWQWLALAVFVLTSVTLAVVLTELILWVLRRRRAWASGLSGRRARLALVWPLRSTLFGAFWYVKVGALGLPEIISSPLHGVAATLVIASGVWVAYIGLGLALEYSVRSVGTAGHQAVFTSLAFGILRLVVIVVGVLFLAEAWSVPYASVLAGLGIGGLAVALAAQQTLQNMIAGFTLFADNPLSVGDFCRYGDKVGTVEQIGLRSTRIRSLDRTVVSVPNSEFANLQLENFTKRDRVLLRTELQLRYETTPDQLRFVLAELRRLLISHPRIHPDPARVRFAGFGAHSLDLEIFAYVLTSDYNEFLAVREDVFLRMMEIVLGSGTGFAFPAQVNYLARDPGIDPAATKEAEAAVARWRESNSLPFPEFAPAELRQLDGRLDYPPKGSPTAAAPGGEQT